MQVLRNYSKCDLAHRFFKGKGKEEHVKECIRPESLITPRSIRKLSPGRTGPTIYIKVQAKKKGGGQSYIMCTSRSLAGLHMNYHVSISIHV